MTNREKAIKLVQDTHNIHFEGGEEEIRACTLHNVDAKNLIDNLEKLLDTIYQEGFDEGYDRGTDL